MKIEPKPINAQFNDEQWEAIQSVGNNILVSASAGSGKTTVLIERIFTHIRKNYAGIDELLVVTFTESAANEMKERMESRLKEAVNEVANPEEQLRLVGQINLLPTAHIRTLHSFCLHVVQQFFYLIDFNPNFKLLTDETQITLMYETVWNNLIEKIYSKAEGISGINQEILADLLSRYSDARSDKGLSDLIIELYQFASSHPEPADWLANMSNINANFETFASTSLFQTTIQQQVKNSALNAYALLEKGEKLLMSLSDETLAKYQPIIEADKEQAKQLAEFALSNDLPALFATAQKVNFTRWASNSKKSEDYDSVNELKLIRDDAKTIIEKNILPLFSGTYEEMAEIEAEINPILNHISQLTLLFSEELKRHKEHLNVIDYNDLEHLTLDIIAPYNTESKQREPSTAANYYQANFKEVLVDEYQDINDIQGTILSFLSRERHSDLAGNLFMVGDVKQSIYGFRMAEPSLFLNKYRTYEQSDEGHLIILDKNYRSRDEVLQFTNFVFERLMNIEFGEMDYTQAESLTTGNDSFIPKAPHKKYNIDFLLYEKESEEEEDYLGEDSELPYLDTSIEAESHIIAQNIQRHMRQRTLIYDKKLEKERPVEYSDFVILSSTRKPFLITQRVFERYNIPLFAQKVENYFQRQEIQLMIALLKIIDNPLQDIPLVAILRSYFVGLDDEALSQIRNHKKDVLYYEAVLNYLNLPEAEIDLNIAQRLTTFLNQLNHWQDLSKKVSLVELIWTIYQETDFLDYVAGLSNGVQRQANLHALYERAKEFEESMFKGVFGFVRYIEKVMQQDKDLAEPILLDETQNFVRIMTVHASKGLEFPIVYLMNTSKKFNLSDARSKRYIASKHHGLGTDLYDYQRMLQFESLSKKAVKIEKENQLKAEEMRKLYVALTRCEQKLIIVGTVKNQATWEEDQTKLQAMTDYDRILIPTQERQSANSWLDWLKQATAIPAKPSISVTHFNPEQINFHFISLDDITQQSLPFLQRRKISTETWLEKQKEQYNKELPINKGEFAHNLEALLKDNYAFKLASNTSSYQSVSELKRLYEEPRIERIDYYSDRRLSHRLNLKSDEKEIERLLEKNSNQEQAGVQSIRYTEDTFSEPRFIETSNAKPSYAEIGTATHFLLQQLNFEFLQEMDEASLLAHLTSLANKCVAEGMLEQIHIEAINYQNLIWFIKSPLGKVLSLNAKTLHREEAFSYLIPANALFQQQLTEEESHQLRDDQLLIHGVIDNFIEFDKEITLIDYKTDRFRTYDIDTRSVQIENIIEKYKFQISLYAQALAQAKGKPVTSANIVLLDFNEVIEVVNLYHFQTNTK